MTICRSIFAFCRVAARICDPADYSNLRSFICHFKLLNLLYCLVTQFDIHCGCGRITFDRYISCHNIGDLADYAVFVFAFGTGKEKEEYYQDKRL